MKPTTKKENSILNNEINNNEENIPTAYFFAIDTSKFKKPRYFKAVVLNRNNKGESFTPLYESISKEEFDSFVDIYEDTPFGKIVFE